MMASHTLMKKTKTTRPRRLVQSSTLVAVPCLSVHQTRHVAAHTRTLTELTCIHARMMPQQAVSCTTCPRSLMCMLRLSSLATATQSSICMAMMRCTHRQSPDQALILVASIWATLKTCRAKGQPLILTSMVGSTQHTGMSLKSVTASTGKRHVSSCSKQQV